MKIMNREQSAKFISSGSIMAVFFYVVLAIFSDGLRDTSLNGVSAIQLLFIPILVAFGGIGLASYNLSFDPDEPWEKGKLISIIFAISITLLLFAQIALIIAGADEQGKIIRPAFFYIGNILMIGSCIAFSVSFFFLRKQLTILYLKKIIIRNPNVMIFVSFTLQTISYCIFFGASFTQDPLQTSIDIAGIVIAAISILLLIGGMIPLNISFRAYSHLLKDESLR